MFSVSKLIEKIPTDGSLEIKKLERILKLTKKADRQKLDIAIEALDKLGVINLEDSKFVSRVDDNTLIQSRLRCSSKGYCFAVRDDGEEDIYIRDHHLNHAWNDDRVLVRVIREGIRRRSPEGEVQCILQRYSSKLLTTIEKEDDKLVAIPLDERILSNIVLPDSDVKHIHKNSEPYVYEVEIDRYPICQFPAEGHITRSIALDGDIESDRQILVSKANLQDQIDPPRVAIKSPIEKNRIDLTSQPAIILNSWNSKSSPFLPAIYVEPHKGGYRLWLHASSIAERVSNGTNLDLWLKDKAEAHCLGDKWMLLLNDALDKASRFEIGKTNEAISVRIDIETNGNVTDWAFCLSLINPQVQITKEILNSLADRKPRSRTIPAKLKPIKDHVGNLQTLLACSKALSENESINGYIELDLPRPDISGLDDLLHEDPSSSFKQYKLPLDLTEPNSIIRPFIQIANRTWSMHANSLNLPGISLIPQSLESYTINDIAKSAVSLNLEIELDEEGGLSPSELSEAFKNSSNRRVLEKQLSHSMQNYSLGLNQISSDKLSTSNQIINYTTPWCCPSLHYHDIANQYVIISLLKDAKDRPTSRAKHQVDLGVKDVWEEITWPIYTETIFKNIVQIFSDEMITNLNIKRRQANSLKESIISLIQARKVEPLIGQKIEAIITGVQSYGFFAEISPMMAEGLVHVSSLNDDWYEYRSRLNRLVGRKNRKIYQLGDSVKVKIINVDILRNQIDLEVEEDNSASLNINNEEIKDDIKCAPEIE